MHGADQGRVMVLVRSQDALFVSVDDYCLIAARQCQPCATIQFMMFFHQVQ